MSYQSLGGAVESMSVVSSELGVGSLEGRVSGSLGLLDTARGSKLTEHFVNFSKIEDQPVTVSLAALVVLGRVL
jgi:hypothetical protein